MPTLGEWDWVARGGSSSKLFIYSGGNDLDEVAWHKGNSQGSAVNLSNTRGTWPVGLKKANELGIYDMTGNVWEWLWTQYFLSDARLMRWARGGGYSNSSATGNLYDPSNVFSLAVLGSTSIQDYRGNERGFRLARNAGN